MTEKEKNMTVVVYDRHGKKWDYPGAGPAGVTELPDGGLRIKDRANRPVGGFHNAAWSHYEVEPGSVGVLAAFEELSAKARGFNSLTTSESKIAAAEDLVERVFWFTDQFAPIQSGPRNT